MNTELTARTVVVDDNRDTVLDTIAGYISAAHQDALAASLLAEEDEPSRRHLCVQRARDAAQSAGHALARLGALGARPAHVPSREPFPPFPSYLLDTMASRRLLALLEEAQVIAERQARAPRPGQKPIRPETVARSEKTPGAKPVARRSPTADGDGTTAGGNGAAVPSETERTEVTGAGANGSGTNGAGAGGATSRPGATGPARPPARRSRKRR